MKDSQTIYLGQDEDIASVIDYLAEADSENIFFVVPEEAEIFSSIVNLRLLKREADLQSKKIIIVSSDKMGKYLSAKAQLDFKSELEHNHNKELEEERKKQAAIKQAQTAADRRPLAGGVAIPVRQMADIISPRQTSGVMGLKQGAEEIIAPETGERPIETTTGEEIEDYASSQNYQRAETGYLSKYLQENKPLPAGFDADSQPAVKGGYRPEKKIFVSSKAKKAVMVLLILGLITFAVAAYFVLPEANLVISPKKDSFSVKATIVADKNLSKTDYALKRIPAQLIKIEKKATKEFPATGQSTESAKAKGIITVYNSYSSSPQTLVSNTRFVSADTGKIFRLTRAIIVPGAKTAEGKLAPSFVDAEAIADQPGPGYNIGPSKFNIPGFEGTPKYNGFYGKSNSAMAGGSAGKTKIVSVEDLESAKSVLSREIKEDVSQAMKDQIPGNLKLAEGALKEESPEITFSQQAGAPAEKFTATQKIQITALVFDTKYVNDLIDKIIVSSLLDKKQPLPNTRQVDYNNFQVNLDKGQISVDVEAKQDVVYKIDAASLKKKLVGKNEAEIKKTLSQMMEIQNAKVAFWPFWVKNMPGQVDKIKIKVE